MRRISFWLALFTVSLTGFVVLMSGVLPAQTAPQTPPQAGPPAATQTPQRGAPPGAPGAPQAPPGARGPAVVVSPADAAARRRHPKHLLVLGMTRGYHHGSTSNGLGHVLESRERMRGLGHGNQDRHVMGHRRRTTRRRPLARPSSTRSCWSIHG